MRKPSFYDLNAQSYFDSTVDRDMTQSYGRFLAELDRTGKKPCDLRILDAGCGSGRDAAYFKNAGYAVEAFDASQEMAKLASCLIGQPVATTRFEDFVADGKPYDAIWACASLLHVATEDRKDVVGRLLSALRPCGVLYFSVKYGRGTMTGEDGRSFHLMDENAIAHLATSLRANLFSVWKSHESERNITWVSVIMRKRRREPA